MYTQNHRFSSMLGLFSVICSLFLEMSFAHAHGNQWNESFTKAKRLLETEVYQQPAERVTLYCQGTFDEKKKITPKEGFNTKKYAKRAQSLEWEHVVPAENFGRTFEAWRDSDAMCVDSKGKHYKGRKCAEKVSAEYRLMQAWNKMYPVTEDECSRAFRIASIQGNQNPFVEQQCVDMGLVH